LDSKRHSHQVYLAETAQAIHDRKRDRTGHHAFLKTGRAFFKALTKELTRKPRVHSVDSFVHFYRDQGKSCPSTTTVYRYIDAGLLELDNMTLPKKLRRRVKGYKNAHKRKNKKIYGDSIELRPAAVNDRTGVGHWEGDLVKGIRSADEPALMTLTERYSRTEIIVKIPDYHADTCLKALQDTINDYGAKEFESITFDNGSEFAKLSEIVGTQIYFAHPYSPWERGTNENTNGLLREYFPKGKSLRDVTLVEIQAVQSALNHRPRRILNYLRPCDYYRRMA
ncbi:IS30 family transposase, partial [Lacticaseibacillus manihotivorans]